MPPTLAEGKLQKQAYANLHVSCLTRQVLRHKSAIYGIFVSQDEGVVHKRITGMTPFRYRQLALNQSKGE